jgi:lipid-binding SYLF domain-containing protein
MAIQRSLMIVLLVCLGVGAALAQQGDSRAATRRQEIDTEAQAALDELFAADSNARDLYNQAVGYAVFRSTKAGFIVSGGGGTGVAVNKTTGQRTYMRMGTGGIGLGIGAQRYNVYLLFETADRLERFIAGGWDSSATAEAAAGSEGVAVRSSFIDGVAFFQLTEKGLMAHADITGTKFWVIDELR